MGAAAWGAGRGSGGTRRGVSGVGGGWCQLSTSPPHRAKPIVFDTHPVRFEAQHDGAGPGGPGASLSVTRNWLSLSTCRVLPCRRVVAQCVVVGELLGYARVSTTVQDPALQLDALRAAGCRWVWTDTASGSRTDRPKLAEVMAALGEGDTLCVWRLDRLGRSLPHLIDTVRGLEERGVGFRSVQESIDTTTPGGRLVFHIFGSLAEFERDLIQERTRAGLDAARARGRKGGRPTVLSPVKRKQATRMITDGVSIVEVAQALGVSRSTLYRQLRPMPEPGK